MRRLIRNSIIFNIIGGILLAFGLYNIHSLTNITEGGMLGMTLLLDIAFGISPAITNIIFSTISYLIGFKVLGKRFIFSSFFAAGSFSIAYGIFEQFPPLFPEIAEMPFLAAIIGGVFVGASVGMCVRFNGAPTGDDALAMSASSKFKIDIKWVYLILDVVVLGLSFFYIDYERVIMSLLTVIISGQVLGFMQTVGTNRQLSEEINHAS